MGVLTSGFYAFPSDWHHAGATRGRLRPAGAIVPARQSAARREAGEAGARQACAVPARRARRHRAQVGTLVSFDYRQGALCAEQVPLDEIARRFGTPCYVYSSAAIEAAYGEFSTALQGRPSMICYSVKANSNLAVLALLARLGAGFDIVSGGEFERVLAAGGAAGRTLVSGVGKSEAEIGLALGKGGRCLNLESESELERVAALAGRLGPRAPGAVRLDPGIDA